MQNSMNLDHKSARKGQRTLGGSVRQSEVELVKEEVKSEDYTLINLSIENKMLGPEAKNFQLNRWKHQILAHKSRPGYYTTEEHIQQSKTKLSYPHRKEGPSLGSTM